MTDQLTDRTSAPVRVVLNEARHSYDVLIGDDQEPVGHAFFLDLPNADRIFFHTEVDSSVEGRGLGGILVGESLLDSIRRQITVVPVCPLFVAHLRKHGEPFTKAGGRMREATPADLEAVAQAGHSAG